MAASWAVVVTLNGVNISASIFGVVTVEAEESVSRIAGFTMSPESGPVDAGDWLGQSVSVNYRTIDSSGGVLTDDRIFTGIVDVALYNSSSVSVEFSCTDNLQGRMESKTQSEIDALIIGSNWSGAVFGEYKDGWLHLENLLSSVPKSYDIDKDGVAGTLAEWAAKPTADYSYDKSNIVHGSMSYSLAPRRNLYNSTVITYEYRFGRLKHREHAFGWSMSNGI